MSTDDTSQIDPQSWQRARRIVHRGLTSSLHCAIASVNTDGTPHVTPIGSVMLAPEPGHGVFLDMFSARLSRNLTTNPAIAILAIESRKRTWLRALIVGHFQTPPGIQLIGTAGPRRLATEAETQRWKRAVGSVINTKGGRALWQHDPTYARDIHVHTVRDLRMAATTRPAPAN